MTLTLHRALFHSWDTVPIAPHSAPVPCVREQDPVPSTRAARAQRPRRRPNEERRPRPLIVLIVQAVLHTPSFYPNNHSLTRLLACPLKHLHTHRTHTAHTPLARPHTHPHTSHMPVHLTSHITPLASYILHLTSYEIYSNWVLCLLRSVPSDGVGHDGVPLTRRPQRLHKLHFHRQSAMARRPSDLLIADRI